MVELGKVRFEANSGKKIAFEPLQKWDKYYIFIQSTKQLEEIKKGVVSFSKGYESPKTYQRVW